MRETPRVAGDSTHDVFGMAVLGTALLSLFLIPEFLGPLSIILGAVAVHRRDRFGPLALAIGLLSVALVLYQIRRASMGV